MRASDIDQDQNDSYLNFKIILLGLTSSGKTKLLIRYKFWSFSPIGASTLAIDSHIVKKQDRRFVYYDTAGQQTFRVIAKTYYKGSDACIIVYDTNSMKSYDQMGYYYNQIKELTENCEIYIVGAKSDLPCLVPEQLIKQNYKGIKHFVTSAKENINVAQTFSTIEQDLVNKHANSKINGSIPHFNNKDFRKLTKKKQKQTSKCC